MQPYWLGLYGKRNSFCCYFSLLYVILIFHPADWFERIGKVKKYCYICNVVVDYALSARPLESSDISVFGLSLFTWYFCVYCAFLFRLISYQQQSRKSNKRKIQIK